MKVLLSALKHEFHGNDHCFFIHRPQASHCIRSFMQLGLFYEHTFQSDPIMRHADCFRMTLGEAWVWEAKRFVAES